MIRNDVEAISTHEVVPFGKYKGQPLSVLQFDKQYCEWLSSQGWFRERYANINTLIVNNFAQPEDTPEHNKLQAFFLEEWFVKSVINLFEKDPCGNPAYYVYSSSKIKIDPLDVRYAKGEEIYVSRQDILSAPLKICDIEFEDRGWDVSVSYNHPSLPSSDASVVIEIKPSLGDDYPGVLRQIKSNLLNDASCILVYDKFTATGATESQIVKMFNHSKVHVFTVDQILKNSNVHNERMEATT